MSRSNTPTDNPVAERFLRTFKSHRIDALTIVEATNFNPSKYVKYVKSLNLKPNKKTENKTPEKHDRDVSTVSMLMVDPIHSKAYSKRFGDDIRHKRRF